MFAGTATAGDSLSSTRTVKVLLAVLFAASLAEHVTVVVPSGNVLPDAGEQLLSVTPTLSLVSSANATTAVAFPASVGRVMSAGTVTVGASASFTRTVKVLLVVLFAASFAKHVTVVGPSGNVLPEAGEHVLEAGTTPTLSDTDGSAHVTTAVFFPASVSFVMSTGCTIVGACMSTTVTVNALKPQFPQSSLDWQFTVVVPTLNVLPEPGVHATTAFGFVMFAAPPLSVTDGA